MKEYTNKKELTDTIKSSYKKYRDEFENIPDREVCKFIHINTVAPFGTFRAKLENGRNLLYKIIDIERRNLWKKKNF